LNKNVPGCHFGDLENMSMPAVRHLNDLPPEMLDFTILKSSAALAPRLGRVCKAGRKAILTPGLLGNTSRGAIPHISQDNFRKCTALNGVYVALEDCEHHHRGSTAI
jgi:queuine tRNA-ribosyltransferase accessory subunit